MKAETEDDWQRRVRRVIELMTGSLDNPPDLDAAAKAATSSPRHFHRCFKALANESFAACLRRLRLERAAQQLHAGRPVLEVALDAGFSSPEAFSRCFSVRFGLNPSRLGQLPWWQGELPAPNGLHFRAGQYQNGFFADTSRTSQARVRNNAAINSTGTTDGNSFGYSTGTMANSRIVQLSAQNIACLGGSGDFWKLPVLWKDFMQYLSGMNLPPLPGRLLTVFEAGLRFKAALLLRDGEIAPEGSSAQQLPGGWYAVTVFFGSTEGIGPFWEQWRSDFFAHSGWSKDEVRPSLEWYQNESPPELPELTLTLLCDPICKSNEL